MSGRETSFDSLGVQVLVRSSCADCACSSSTSNTLTARVSVTFGKDKETLWHKQKRHMCLKICSESCGQSHEPTGRLPNRTVSFVFNSPINSLRRVRAPADIFMNWTPMPEVVAFRLPTAADDGTWITLPVTRNDILFT